MTLIQLHGIAKRFGGRPIFTDLDWTIEDGVRLGLVGPNGAGKSTLLKIAHGQEEIDDGDIARQRGLTTAYLPQHVLAEERTPIQLVVAARDDVAAVDQELDDIQRALGEPETAADMRRMERLLAQQERALEKLEQLNAAGIEGEAKTLLRDMGLGNGDLDRPIANLSGGQRKLAYLAACLGRRPDLLFLDEPETHLDLVARGRLEDIIRRFEGAVVIVSHDRYLLDETVTGIVQLDGGQITHWKGNYSAYAVAKEIALRRQEALYASQQKEIARLEEAVRRFEEWASRVVDERHIKQARNKQRQIDRMEKVDRPVLERRKIRLSLHEQHRSGQKVVELTSGALDIGDASLLHDVDLAVWRGDRVGVIGGNGAGKTMLARLVSERLPLSAGVFWIGPSVKVGYFSQTEETLPPNATPVDLIRVAQPLREDQAVAQLMKFLFRYDQIRQKTADMSGGERSRLQLLLLMLGGANFLVLDEPTNHLDIESMEALENALEEFPGTVFAVSHDRYFLDRIADRILEVRDRAVHAHIGGYSDWLLAEQSVRVM